MRKVLWYSVGSKEHAEKEKGTPIYYTGPWWAFWLHDILWSFSFYFTEWAMDIEKKFLELDDKEGDKNEMDKRKNL